MSGFFSFLAILAFLAFVVGMIKPGLMVFWSKKKTRGTVCLYLAAMVVFGIIAGSASGGTPAATTTAKPITSSAISSSAAAVSQAAKNVAPPVAPASSAAALKPYSATLSSGYYTVGVDFPAGTYTITAVKGNGNVTTNDGSLNAIMGTGKEDMYEKEYKNADLKDGTVLTLSGITVKITSKNGVDVTLKNRTNAATKSYTLSSGNYIAGSDIEAGTYDLSVVKGAGNVQTEDGSLNAIMGTNSEDMYQQKYMHVELKKDVKLIISGATIKLTPSK